MGDGAYKASALDDGAAAHSLDNAAGSLQQAGICYFSNACMLGYAISSDGMVKLERKSFVFNLSA